jgi:hypothetical protein
MPPCVPLPQIRDLISACLARVYATADTLPMFSRISELQSCLAAKDGLGKLTSDVGGHLLLLMCRAWRWRWRTRTAAPSRVATPCCPRRRKGGVQAGTRAGAG